MPLRSDDDDTDNEEEEEEEEEEEDVDEARRALPFPVEERKVDGVAKYDALFPLSLPNRAGTVPFVDPPIPATAPAAERPVEMLRCALRLSRPADIDR